jgi:hypothetical protein
MSQITSSEIFYEVSLRDITSELTALYGKWVRDLVTGNSHSEYHTKLQELEFSAYRQIYEDIRIKTSALAKTLDRLFLIDTSQLNSAMENARQQKITSEQFFTKEGKIEDGIKLMKQTVDNLFKIYSDWKANRRNLEKKTLLKWCGIMGGGYLPAMVVYFQVLDNMHINSDFTFGIVIPVAAALFLVLLLFAIFSQE